MGHEANGTSVGILPARVTRLLVLGFYDGATDGVLQLGPGGPVFRFELPPDVDEGAAVTARERPFDLRPLPPDALDRLAAILAPYDPPRWPAWFVTWRFPDEATERRVEARVAAVLSEAGPRAWRLTTPDPWNFATAKVEPLTAAQPA